MISNNESSINTSTLFKLAIQVTNELSRVSSNHVPIGTIVGGFAEVKQRRILERKRPPILVCTPGRLWELVSYYGKNCVSCLFVQVC